MKMFSFVRITRLAGKDGYEFRRLKYRTAPVLFFCFFFLLAGVLSFTSCKKHDDSGCKGLDSNSDLIASTHGLSRQTLCELQQAREATEKYRNFSAAMNDHYDDIDVVMPNMGYHFMKSAIVDTVFDISRPEILVYNKDHDDHFELVAIEYAVPIDTLSNKAPEGFTGSKDVWDHNTGFGLWLLHAWVWKNNPSGVFNPTNPSVHVH